ncbi:hypothetical protein CLOM_g17978 [Closterium sp. NIES-68]|nr:hypothetical protein CLOM_g17978 [Closterium sp. NIES-68]
MALTSSGSAPPMAPACPPSLLLGPAAAAPNLQRTHDGRMDGACAREEKDSGEKRNKGRDVSPPCSHLLASAHLVAASMRASRYSARRPASRRYRFCVPPPPPRPSLLSCPPNGALAHEHADKNDMGEQD